MLSFLAFLILMPGLSGCNGSGEQAKSSKTQKSALEPTHKQPLGASDTGQSTSDTNNKNIHSSFSWLKLNGWHTQGIVSSQQPIKIVFNREIIDADRVGMDASDVMHITPKVAGNPVFKSSTEIAWIPAKKLQPDTEYKVSIKPYKLKGVPENIAPYQFSFHVIPLEFEIKTFALMPLETDQGTADISGMKPKSQMLLKGELLVSDRVSPEGVEKTVKASQQGKRLPIEWNHQSNGKQHAFVIHGITRETFATDLVLEWNGELIKISSAGKKEIRVPAINEFAVTRMRVVHGDAINPYIEVSFSDDLDSHQNLKGLVTLAKNKFRIQSQNNIIKIYPNKNLTGSFTVTLSEGIKGNNGQLLKRSVTQKIEFDKLKPQVRFVGKGSILPENSTLEIPFEALAVNKVQVTAFEIYPDNVKQFLQVNGLSGGYETRRTGRYLWRKTIPLTAADPDKWNRYSFDVTDLMKGHQGGLLRLTLDIKRQYSTYGCPASTPKPDPVPTLPKNLEDNGVQKPSGWDGISDYVEDSTYYDYKWNDRHDPCKDAYYRFNQQKTSSSQNFIASNIGLIAKQESNGNLRVISTDIRTAQPLTGVDLEVRNYQGQVLAKAKSDGSGFAKMALSSTPFLLLARKFEDVAYLKVNAKTALAVSQFDVGGKKTKKGIKGMIYGERGVWRPGDTIYLTFVLQEKHSGIPDGHPVTMKLIDPRGRVLESKTSNKSVGGFYAFKFKTPEKAETGRWMAKALLGGSTFSKSLMIETVRPNRLKVDLEFLDEDNQRLNTLYSSNGTPRGKLFSQWLHGAKASNLKADIALRFSPKKTSFGRFADFIFDDPARSLKSPDKIILQGRLDDEGYLEFKKDIRPRGYAAGLLRATFTTRVFEEGGSFSINRNSLDYHPYENYVGIKLPKGDATRNMLLTDKLHTVEIASLNDKGEPVSLPKVQISLYKIKWKWWWDKSSETLAKYADSKNTGLLEQAIISTVDGKGSWQFSIKYPQWGRYLTRACDLEGKHCTGKTVFVDWPGWAGRAQQEGSGSASRLNIFSDKTRYTVGETASIQLPAIKQGRALMTLETGSTILEQRWIEPEQSEHKRMIEIPISAAMAPNVYVHVTLLQPHKDKHNDRPIRLYGIIPLLVSDPGTHLHPQLDVAEEWKPETSQTIKVSESAGKPMNYTLAIVDEGLLGLTSFKTPDLHKYFYSKEGLGIKTWDLFDQVIGAYGGKLERMLALGGGDEAEVDNEDSKKRRFPPVVRVLGPFHLKAGESATHEVTLPAYLGAVRVMLVAGDKGAYGKAQQSVYVRQPLMLQASLPRVLGPGEEVSVPLTLFVTDNLIKDVALSVDTNDLISVTGNTNPVSIHFDSTGDQLVFMRLKTAHKTGKAQIGFSATSTVISKAAEKHYQSAIDISLDVRRANQETTRTQETVIEPGGSWQRELKPFGLEGTNHARLELSSVPLLNLEKRLEYLVRYPHGCLEQTTSSVFPQLYLPNLMSLNKKRQQDIEYHINKAIERIGRFQNGNGNFSYWPGGNDSNAWASVYAGHFLIEAQKQGYLVPAELLANWISYQIDTAQGYLAASKKYSHLQAYRLYVLALAGKPQLGAMNRLRESSKLNRKARWMLASAYQRASQPDAASALIQGMQATADVAQSSETTDDTFSSTLGDLGIQLQSLLALNKKQDANRLLEKIATEMSRDAYQSTQGIAWALMSVSRYLGEDTTHFNATIIQQDKTRLVDSKKPVSSQKLDFSGNQFRVENTSGIRLFATLVNDGVAAAGQEQALQQGLVITTRYDKRIANSNTKDKKHWQESDLGQPVLQGDDIRMHVTVKNAGNHTGDNIALTLPVASGMEIFPLQEQPKTSSHYDYRDLRDDRIYYYFSLKPGESKTFELLVNASYLGRFYLPPVRAEAMYDGKMQARTVGQWITIVKTLEKKLFRKKPMQIPARSGSLPIKHGYTSCLMKLPGPVCIW